MYLRWLAAVLLSLSLIIGVVIAANVEIANRIESFIIEDEIVEVPPWNSTEGWIGFNKTLPNKHKTGYEAYGVVLPVDVNQETWIVMYVVNETGLNLLRFDQFSEYTWDVTKIYAAAYLNKTRKVSEFRFLEVDNSSLYCFIFRGVRNATASYHILINFKEAFFEQVRLLEPTPTNTIITASLASAGLITLIVSFRQPDKKRLRRRKLHTHAFQ